MKNRSTSVVLLFAAAILAQPLSAQTEDAGHPLLTDKFAVAVGAFVFDKDVRFRVDGADPGDNIDFDERWGQKSEDASASFVARWRFGEKWSLAGQYFKTDDSTSAVLEEDVHREDIIFRQGSNIGAGIDITVARLFLGRCFHAGPNHEFGLGAGLHWLEIGAYLEGEIYINDESTGFHRKRVSAEAPLPNLDGLAWCGETGVPGSIPIDNIQLVNSSGHRIRHEKKITQKLPQIQCYGGSRCQHFFI